MTVAATQPLQTSADIALADIAESPLNHRKYFDEAKIEELAKSIEAHGVLQPVLVRPSSDPKRKQKWELVYGHSRFRAAKIAGLKAIPASARELTDRQVLEVALVENCRRSDVQPLEEAEAYRELHEKHGLKVEEIAEQVGTSKEYVYARMKLCELSEAGKNALAEGALTASSALEVARLEPKLQEKAVAKLLARSTFADAGPADPVPAREAKWIVDSVVAQEEYREARKKNAPKEKAQKQKDQKQRLTYEEERKRDDEKRALRERVARKALDVFVSKVEQSKETTVSFLRWVALELLNDYDGEDSIKHRGWAKKDLPGKVKVAAEGVVRGLIFEAIVGRAVSGSWGGYSSALKDLAGDYKVDLKKLEKQVLALEAEQKEVDAGVEQIKKAASVDAGNLCGLRDGKSGDPCFHLQHHKGVHSNGTRTWSERKKAAAKKGGKR